MRWEKKLKAEEVPSLRGKHKRKLKVWRFMPLKLATDQTP
jgi:hypothetical protein